MIGVFDSGIGGLTVLRALKEALPERSFLYFGDTARTPYGNKSAETIIRYGREDAALLVSRGAKLIVIACNTVSAIAADNLKKEFGLPIFEVVGPAAAEAIKKTKNRRVGVIGTRATIESGVYQKLLEQAGVEVFSQACPLFVPLVEEGWEGESEAREIVKKSLNPLKLKNIDVLILGCTHYPLLYGPIAEALGPQTAIIDSARSVAEEVKNFLGNNQEFDAGLQKGADTTLMVSDSSKHFVNLARLWLGSVKIEQTK